MRSGLGLSRDEVMRIQRRRPRELSSQRADIVVVIDVLRMTSTAAVLMSRPSCTRVAAAATLEDLERFAGGDLLVVSELGGARNLGAWVDNSPARVSRIELGTRTPVLVTTNGTRTLLAAAACTRHVLLASFVDLCAVARHIREIASTERSEAERGVAISRGVWGGVPPRVIATPSVLLVPAGDFASGEGRIEDDLCADALESLLAGRQPDLAGAAAAIRADARVRTRLAEPGLAADLDVALQGDARAGALEFSALDAGVGHIVRACPQTSELTHG